MSYYEMPQSLKKRYQETIEIGLIKIPREYFRFFVVLLFVCIFLIKINPINTYVTFGLVTALFGGGVFMLQMGVENVKTAWDFRRTPKSLGCFDPQLRKFTKVEKIDRDTLFIEGGQLRALLLTHYVNFDAMDEKQIAAFNDAMCDFIDSLDYPIQFTVRSVELNMENYWQWVESRIDKSDKEKMKMYEDKKRDSQELTKRDATTNKIYITVIPYDRKKGIVKKAKAMLEGEENDLEALDIRVETSRKMLARAGVMTSRMDNDRLISLLAGYFQRYGGVGDDYLSFITFPHFGEEDAK